MAEALSKEADSVTSVRLNPFKKSQWTVDVAPVPWCEEGGYLTSRPAFTFDPFLHAGLYYVQEASSMFLSHVLRTFVKQPVRMLDLCAAPGGKSTVALSALPEGSLLVSNEIDSKRAQILSENIQKWGCPNVCVTHNAPADFRSLKEFFDVIVTDVPCSGEGMFRKDPRAVEEWSLRNVSLCEERQRSILEDIWGCLRPGGLLVYSTCTFNQREDEGNVHWLVERFGAEPLEVPVKEDWHIVGNGTEYGEPVYHFFPHKTKGEGFFLAVLRKPGVHEEKKSKRPKKKGKEKGAVVPQDVMNRLERPQDFIFTQSDSGMIYALPSAFSDEFRVLDKELYVLHKGVGVAQVKGKNYLPTQSLALSVCLNHDAFPACQLDYAQAMAYLRGEALTLSADTPKGYVLVEWEGCPLGFVKNLGNRSNTLYPQNWKVRSSYLPQAFKPFLQYQKD